jgi:hypothetical protein
MILGFETSGENKAVMAAERVAGALKSVKQGYASVSKELGVLRKGMNIAGKFGFAGGIAGGMIGNALGQMTEQDKKELGPAGEVGFMAGTFIGTGVGAKVAEQIVGKTLGKAAGGLPVPPMHRFTPVRTGKRFARRSETSP